jgi:hypothetical protein
MSSTEYNKQVTNTTDFYESLLTDGGGVFAALDPLLVTYNRAYDLYEYALFQYIHNSSIYHNMAFEDLEHLRALASQQQFQMNTPDQNGDLTTVAGKTLASKILAQFQQMSDSSGVSDKLTILFGSYEPFLAFFALSGLTSGSTTKPKFNSLPDHGSIMAFELFSYVDDDQQNESVPFPSTADLWVRFMFRNGTNETDGLVAYPLFSHGPSSIDMTWSDFVMNMGEFAMNEVADWCTACLSDNLFCAGIMENINGSQDEVVNGKKQLSPVIGGVIGATLTIGLFIICTLVLLLLGFRLDYHEKRKGTESNEAGGLGVLKRSVTGGGFKGAEKLASDTDLRLKGGAGVTVIRHERVGSWELNESPTDRKHSSLDKEIESGRQASYGRRSEDVGRENVDPFGDPVEAVDQV